MELNQVTVPARDMDESCAFYRLLGFRQIVASPHYARFECPGGATFSLDLDEQAPAASATVYFEHEALDVWVASLKQAGVEFVQEPTDMSYLWREAVLFDPTGNRIKLYWAGENRRFPPWRIGGVNQGEEPGFMALARSPQVAFRALRVALLVGTLLFLINYGDRALRGDLGIDDAIKILLTFFVPYGVSTWSSVQTLRAQRQGRGALIE